MITNLSFANAPYLGLPGTGISNLGGRTQIFTTDSLTSGNTQPYMTLFGSQGGQTYGCQQQSYPVQQACAPVNPYRVINEAQCMLADTLNKMTSANIDSALGAVVTQANQLRNKYNNGNVSNEIKTVIAKQVEQLESLERQLNILKTNNSNLDPQTAYQRSVYLQVSATNLIDLSSTTIKAMEAQAKSVAQATTPVDPTDPSANANEPKTDEEKAQKVKEDNVHARAGEDDIDPVQNEKEYYETMTTNLYDAMKGWGTDDKKLEAELDKINKDTVLPLMLVWNDKYPNESFMEMFMADADATQKKQYGMRIANALNELAAEAGIDLSQDPDMQKIQSEVFNSWFWINNSVADNYNNIIKKLAAAAGIEYNYSEYSMF